MTAKAALERTLHDEIPLTRAMDLRVASYDHNCLRLSAPLAANINHKSTAFGGSLYSLAVLCGWGMVHLKLAEAGLHKHIVIQDANIRYLLPVEGEMQADCCLDEVALQNFMHALKKHGRARLELKVAIQHNGQNAVEFSGRYVVHS